MIHYFLQDQSFLISGLETPPADVVSLNQTFFKNSYKLNQKKIKIRELKAVRIPNIADQSEYFLFKISSIKKIGDLEIMLSNKMEWLTSDSQNDIDFFINDDGLTILNADGTKTYNRPPLNTAMFFGISKESIPEYIRNSDNELNAIFYRVDNNSNLSVAPTNHIFVYYLLPKNIIQKVIFRPFNRFLNLFLPKLKPIFGGGSSAGVRIPKRA